MFSIQQRRDNSPFSTAETFYHVPGIFKNLKNKLKRSLSVNNK